MSLQLVERKEREDLYSVLVHFVGAVPILIFTASFSSDIGGVPLPLILYSLSLLLLTPTFVMDLIPKKQYTVFFLVSVIIHILSVLMIVTLMTIQYSSLIYTLTLASTSFSLFTLRPISISEKKIKEVKTRFGTAGFQDALVLKDIDLKNETIMPLDLGIMGVDNFPRYLFGDYYSPVQSSHPPVVFAFAVTTVLQISIQKYPPVDAVIQLLLIFVSMFMLGYMFKVWMAIKYAQEDFRTEVKYRLELRMTKEEIHKVKRPEVITTVFSLLILISSFSLAPVPSGKSQFVNLLEPSTDILLPIFLIPFLFILYGFNLIWRKTLWFNLRKFRKKKK